MSILVNNKKTDDFEKIRNELEETKEILKKLYKKKLHYEFDRGDKLEILSARADDLNMSSNHFHGSARRVQRRMKWQNYKVTFFISKFYSFISR